jgi:hypothetical protein
LGCRLLSLLLWTLHLSLAAILAFSTSAAAADQQSMEMEGQWLASNAKAIIDPSSVAHGMFPPLAIFWLFVAVGRLTLAIWWIFFKNFNTILFLCKFFGYTIFTILLIIHILFFFKKSYRFLRPSFGVDSTTFVHGLYFVLILSCSLVHFFLPAQNAFAREAGLAISVGSLGQFACKPTEERRKFVGIYREFCWH